MARRVSHRRGAYGILCERRLLEKRPLQFAHAADAGAAGALQTQRMTDFLWTGFSSAACGSMRSSAVTRRNGNGDRASQSTSSSKPTWQKRPGATNSPIRSITPRSKSGFRLSRPARRSSSSRRWPERSAASCSNMTRCGARRSGSTNRRRAACPVGRGRT